ncbi:unknown protein; 24862-27391 [Arabidopsis thaliana]|nr:unknown protein; 24862-27391 [Arabidopsis thaliana]
MERSISFNPRGDNELPDDRSSDVGYAANDRRLAYSRSFQQSHGPRTPAVTEAAKPFLDRTVSSIDMPPDIYSVDGSDVFFGEGKDVDMAKVSVLEMVWEVFGVVTSGNRQMKRLFLLIALNVLYSTTELSIGIFTGRVGLVSDAFHLTFGCGLLTFSLFAMATSRKKPDHAYSYGQLFLMFMSFSLAVEALHAFIQDESEHKHYLIVSAVTNLLVNLLGVWFFRNYARVNIAYRKAEDMNYHSVCLHVISDSIRSAGLILASWLLSLGVENAEVLCLGLVSVTVFMLVMPLFKATGGVLLQMAPPNIPSSALSKCLRQITSREDVTEVLQARFWEVVPGHTVGSLRLQVKSGIDERPLLQYVYDVYHDLGVQDLTLQTDYT